MRQNIAVSSKLPQGNLLSELFGLDFETISMKIGRSKTERLNQRFPDL